MSIRNCGVTLKDVDFGREPNDLARISKVSLEKFTSKKNVIEKNLEFSGYIIQLLC